MRVAASPPMGSPVDHAVLSPRPGAIHAVHHSGQSSMPQMHALASPAQAAALALREVARIRLQGAGIQAGGEVATPTSQRQQQLKMWQQQQQQLWFQQQQQQRQSLAQWQAHQAHLHRAHINHTQRQQQQQQFQRTQRQQQNGPIEHQSHELSQRRESIDSETGQAPPLPLVRLSAAALEWSPSFDAGDSAMCVVSRNVYTCAPLSPAARTLPSPTKSAPL